MLVLKHASRSRNATYLKTTRSCLCWHRFPHIAVLFSVKQHFNTFLAHLKRPNENPGGEEPGSPYLTKMSAGSSKDFACTFAISVTAPSGNNDWVARKGDQSLFCTLNRLFPDVVQPEKGRRRLKGKIREAEFNKALQSQYGFVCARTRRKTFAR